METRTNDISIPTEALNKAISVNRKRRNRGYSFETDWIKRLNELPDWSARRMGGSSTGMPDVVATYHEKGANILYSCEFKSGYGNNLYVPYDQVIRSIKLADMFRAYEKRYLVLAFKFANEQRRPFYWFYGFDMDGGYIDLLNQPVEEDESLPYQWIKSTVKGVLIINGKKGEALLPWTAKTQSLPFPTHFLQ